MKTPILIINLKTYEETEGQKAVEILGICEEIAKKTGKNIAISPTALDIKEVAAKKKRVYVLAQHADAVTYGSNTGSIVPKELRKIGVDGTLINHSEKTLTEKDIKNTIKLCNEEGLDTVLCVENSAKVNVYKKYKPDFIAVEPPELIGGEISISSAKPEIISESVKNSGDIPLLCGAGVKNANDVAKSVELGAQGILVASGVVKVENIEEAIMDLLKPL